MSRAAPVASDAALVHAAQAGDTAALGALLARHRSRLHAIAVGILGHGPQAEDAVQETFLIALRRIGELRDPDAARAWLAAVVVNVCRGQLRRRDAPVAVAPDAWDPPGPDTVEQAIDSAAMRDWVWTALDRLSEPLRLAVVLRYFTGASSYEAIAAMSGVPVGTVRSRLSAAKRRLADELLETAAAEHADDAARLRPSAQIGAAHRRFEHDGDHHAFDGVLTRDVAFVMSDGVERHGASAYAQRLARNLEDGVRARLESVLPGSEVTVVEVRLDNPPGQPLHCPPAMTQVLFHRDGPASRIVAHYAPRPSG
jgi:RNA polymerase sigma factor (sigma-70 family)